MTAGRAADAVPIDAAMVRAALDGRTQRWLAHRSGIGEQTICRLLQSGRDGRPQYALRSTYERMRGVLPTLPPAPGPSNGRAAGEGEAGA